MSCADIPAFGRQRAWPKASADSLLSLAAAPTFAIMALVTAIHEGAMPAMRCAAEPGALPFTGMVAMYLLMSAFHSVSWLRLIRHWRGRASRA